jgi:RNA polymerase sigma-70 factor (ECF subfamily)
VLTRCGKNDRGSQRQLFLSLHEFALGICYRYTSFREDPEIPMYGSFLKLFTSIGQFNSNGESDVWCTLKTWFKNILIDTCIESGKRQIPEVKNSSEWNPQLIPLIEDKTFRPPSAKEILYEIRRLDFHCRVVFNLSVIDGFTYQDISSKLQIPNGAIEFKLRRAREELYKLVQPMSTIRSA